MTSIIGRPATLSSAFLTDYYAMRRQAVEYDQAVYTAYTLGPAKGDFTALYTRAKNRYYGKLPKYREASRRGQRLRYDPTSEKARRRKNYYGNLEHNRALARAIMAKKRTTVEGRIELNLRVRLRMAAHGKCYSLKTVELIGCDFTAFKKHIERLFMPGMSWENYGLKGWHIDHHIPCAAYDLVDPEEAKKCFHFSNLRPLWAEDNKRKNNLLPDGTRATRKRAA